ncbi:MAG TPA: hypothetical protein VLA24_04300, partial [Pseudomonadales bacterium]|nr:hypothetical protein [Pseudomonadales bacterium]
PIAFDIHREARLSASLVLCLFNLTRLWAGFAERFDHGFYVDAFPKCLLTYGMLLLMVIFTKRNGSPIIWLLSHACTAAYPDVSHFYRHILAAINAAMKRSNEVHMPL